MSKEFEGNEIPNLSDVLSYGSEAFTAILLKPVFSQGVLVLTNDQLTDKNREEWVEKIDLLLQHGVDILLGEVDIDLNIRKNYRIIQRVEKLETPSLIGFLTENNIEALDGSTR